MFTSGLLSGGVCGAELGFGLPDGPVGPRDLPPLWPPMVAGWRGAGLSGIRKDVTEEVHVGTDQGIRLQLGDGGVGDGEGEGSCRGERSMGDTGLLGGWGEGAGNYMSGICRVGIPLYLTKGNKSNYL